MAAVGTQEAQCSALPQNREQGVLRRTFEAQVGLELKLHFSGPQAVGQRVELFCR